jgi:predicted nucleotidyltransferase
MNWLHPNTIYVTLHGSQAYGLANEFSDVDVKGICVPPRDVEYNLYHRFEQAENNPALEASLTHLKNPKNPKFESSIYSLRKFFLLAAEVNPNIIELLWTDPSHHFVKKPLMEKLLANREMFLSNKARYTFAGYACAQAKKIERHRKWIVLGEVKPPKREDFGLPAEAPKQMEEIFGFVKSKVEQWNLNQFPLDEMARNELKDSIWEIVSTLTDKELSVANWPDRYAEGIIFKMQKDFNLKDEVVEYIHAERAYAKAKQVYDSWVSWKKERNPARRELEEKSGYDTKHASHLVRLMRMGYEIVSEGKVIVNRVGLDADELLSIKNGGWSFEKVMEFKEEMEAKLDAEYNRQKKAIAAGEVVPLPREVNKEKLNSLYHELYEEYWNAQEQANAGH